MPVVANFVMIRGDDPLLIGSAAVELPFNTGGRDAGHTAFLIFNVRGLNSIVPVKVNNVTVGSLFKTEELSARFATQMVALQGSSLKDGTNELQLEGAGNDQFEIKDVFCFFGQSV
jgi:hypothetical protein